MGGIVWDTIFLTPEVFLMEADITYFLGANSPEGFFSLYPELIDPRRARAVWLLKGGPGCGKSTLMKRVAQAARDAGLAVETILCSGDPDSLDALLLPELDIAIADATAPHVMEPKVPGVAERYLDLGACYDFAALQSLRGEIMACMEGYPDCYSRAYRCLEAAAELGEDMRACLLTPQLRQRLARRAAALLRRELKPKRSGEKGRVKQRFLTAVTHRGPVALFGTVRAQCPRVILLQDSYALGHDLLMELLTGAVERGYDVVACPDPMAPDRLLHLLIPEVGLAFITSSPAQPWEGDCLRRIRLDALPEDALLRSLRPRLRFARKVSAALMEEAVSSLAQAKEMHDELERLYNPHVDFTRVNQIADGIISEILSQPDLPIEPQLGSPLAGELSARRAD